MENKNKILIASTILSTCILLSSYIITKSIDTLSMRIYSSGTEISRNLNDDSNNVKYVEENDILSLSEAADYIGIDASRVVILVKEQDLPCVKFDNIYLFSKEAIKEWFNGRSLKTGY